MITLSSIKGHPYLTIENEDDGDYRFIAEQYHYEILGEVIVRKVPDKYFLRFSGKPVGGA